MTTNPDQFAGVEMKQADRMRKHLPGGGELAQMIRDGATPYELVELFDSSKTTIYSRLRESGYKANGEPITYDVVRKDPAFMFSPEPWTDRAECSKPTYDPNWWHSDGPAARYETKMAKKVCLSCPVRMECLTYGLKVDEQVSGRHGVYGGLTGDDRKALVEKGVK